MSAGPLNFVSWIAIPLSVVSFIALLAGMAFGRFNYKIRREGIVHPALPPDFEGFKIIQISDLHLGSMYGKQHKLARAIDMINRENPDIIAFTGDLVNNLANEAEGWTDLLSALRSRYGNYSILGNHDYGDHYQFDSESERQDNLDQLVEAHRKSGFSVLLNQSAEISMNGSAPEHPPSSIFLAGVENWGEPPFKQYGDLEKALKGIPENAFTVLLSHDPSHWDAEVLDGSHPKPDDSATQVSPALTLSGHTHGMQFGFRTRWFRWSPVQLKYPRWVGLYKQGQQYLYVSPGLGYVGYAGRIFIPPEISVLTLHRPETPSN